MIKRFLGNLARRSGSLFYGDSGDIYFDNRALIIISQDL